MTVYKCDICKKELELGKTTICHIVRIDTCKHLDLCEECFNTLESVAEALKRGEDPEQESGGIDENS